MLIAIRISGQVNIQRRVEETLYRLRLRRKYSAVILKPTSQNIKLLKKMRDHIAYGPIDKETLLLLLEKRAKPKNKSKKIKAKEIIEQLEKKDINNLDIKPFFRLHPPRGGIDAKKHFPVSKKAVLGDNKDKINDLIRRML